MVGVYMLYELKYTNDLGESVKFGSVTQGFVDTIGVAVEHRNSFLLVNFEGFGEVGADVQLQKAPFQDGSTHVDTLLDERTPYIEFIIHADNFAELSTLRKKTGRVFNPKINGCFTLSYDDKTYQIKAIPEHVPVFSEEDKNGNVQTASVNFICPNPYWQSTTITEEPAFEPKFRFPIPFYDNPGKFIMGIQRDQRVIINDGDAPMPLQIEFFGPALNPKIINNTTGEYIKVNQMLYENEKMMIDTTDGNKSVFFVDENGNERDVFNWIDLGSTFFDLVVGENDIEYTADSDIQGAIVNISYSKLYTSV